MSLETIEMWDAIKDVKYRRTLEALQRIIQDTQGDLNAAITVSLDMVAAAVHAEAGTFWFYDRFGDGLIRPRAVYGGGKIKDMHLLPGEGVAGGVIESGEDAMISNCQKDSRWAGKFDAATGFCTRSMICVPLKASKGAFGCIQIINKTDGLLFDEKELTFALRLAEAIADLFLRNGLLEQYKQENQTPDTTQITFAEVFGAPTPRDMEIVLRGMGEFAGLRVADQKQVLEQARQIWQILGLYKNNIPSQGKSRKLFSKK